MTLERVAVHQTRLRAPGLGLDAKGVALGAKGLVLLPSVERLVAFLALFSGQGSLADILRSLAIEVVRSKLGAREVTLAFTAESSDRMDRVAELARLAGGLTFTGSSRHFVQYRDAAAPFGYDVAEVAFTDAALALYHASFTQSYDVERTIDVRALLCRLEPQLDPSAGREPGPRWVVAEAGLGPAFIHYLVRSGVAGEVGMAEWPPSSSFDEAPVTRYLFRLPALPERMRPLLARTPGLSVFVPAAPGAAVEVGFRHPVELRACPVFPGEGLVLFRGRTDPLEIPTLPALGDVAAFARFELRGEVRAAAAARPLEGSEVAVQVRLAPSRQSFRVVTASFLQAAELPLLRRIAYVLGPETLARVRIAFTSEGAFLRHDGGVEAVPVGEFYRSIHPSVFVPAGYEAVPAVAPDVLFRALGAPAGQVLFLTRGGTVGVPAEAFVPLEAALLEAHAWAPAAALGDGVSSALATELPEVVLGPVGLLPLRDVAAAPGASEGS